MGAIDPAGSAERTAADSAESLTAAAPRAEELTSARRGWLRRYLHRHPRVTDVVVAACYVLTSSGIFLAPNHRNLLPHAALVVAAAVALMFRRYGPLTVVSVLFVLEIVNLIIYPTGSNTGVSLWFGLYAVAVHYSAVRSFAAAAAVSLPMAGYLLFLYKVPPEALTDGGPSAQVTSIISAVIIVLSNVIATGIGVSVRRGREHEKELRSWAVRNAQLASVAERNRIAREMHDVVAHSLTVMVALSDGAAVVVKRNPDRAAEVLGQLSETGRTALADMRRVLGVLRNDDGGTRAPLPDRADLTGLIEGFRQAGLPLTVTHSGPTLPGDAALQLSVYRIVQESLTNVLRYGTAVSRVQLVIENNEASGELRIKVTDDGRGSVHPSAGASMGTGQGIAGMRERAGIYAGTVTAGPGAHGGWVVEAVLRPQPAGD